MKYIVSLLAITLMYLILPTPLHEESTETLQEDISRMEIVEEKLPEQLILENMSPEEKVGQLFIFGFDGTSITPENKAFLQEHYIGGVLLLGKNISSEKQLKQLIQDIQSTNKIPLFISIDQEGGIVSRIKWNKTLTTSQSEIDTPNEAYNIAKSRGEILKNIGINMNLAPVVEYITNPDSFMFNRVYRGSREDVYNKSISAVKGYTDSGIISVPKHYPGHSDTSPDSHYILPTVDIATDQWGTYTEPFTKILEQTAVDALMIGHIEFTNIDSKPATLSYEIITDRLINNLKYTGLVISDDMEMDALEKIDTYINVAKQALIAGNDILIYSKYSNASSSLQREVYEYILQEVKDGNLNIDDKVLKILKTKIKYNILNQDTY